MFDTVFFNNELRTSQHFFGKKVADLSCEFSLAQQQFSSLLQELSVSLRQDLLQYKE